jgi:hypothetical protein
MLTTYLPLPVMLITEGHDAVAQLMSRAQLWSMNEVNLTTSQTLEQIKGDSSRRARVDWGVAQVVEHLPSTCPQYWTEEKEEEKKE